MRITHYAIDHPRIIGVTTILVTLLAVIAALDIAVQRSPAINTAVVLVTVPYPGSEPTEVEEQITRKIEDGLQRLNKVDFIASTSMRGASVTQIIFLDGVEAKRARDDVEHLVNQVRRELPVGREVQPQITEIDFESAPIMLVTIAGPPGFDERALKQIAEDVQDELEAIPGVANTQIFGGREREIHVNVDPDLAVQYGVTLNDVRNVLSAAHVEMPGGALASLEYDPQVVNKMAFKGVDDIREVVLRHDEGRMIRVKDVAEVLDTYRRRMSFAQLDGRDSATIIVNKESNINSLGAAQAIKERVDELQKQYPHLALTCTRDVSEEIGVMFQVLGSSAIFGGMLVVIILAWSMGLLSSFLVILAIPTSTAFALVFLYASDIPISSMVIFSYILVLGMVVDGAIIVAENIHRHIERGEPPITAAKIGISEVEIPVFSADMTTICAFLPMLLVPGIMGDFMGVMPKVVTAALVGSLLVDHFVLPVIAGRLYRQHVPPSLPHEHRTGAAPPPERLGRITRIYRASLKYALENRWVVMSCCAIAIAWAFFMLKLGFINFTFFPSSDRGQFEINFELPLGYSIEETTRASKVITDALLPLKESGEMRHFVTAIGSSAGLASRLEGDPANGPEFGKVMVELLPPSERKRTQSEIIRQVRNDIKPWPGMLVRVEEIKEGPPGGFDVAVRLTGKDLDQLGALSRLIEERLAETDGTDDVGSDYRPNNPEIQIEPFPEVVGLFDMNESDVARAITTAILGDTTIQLALDDEDVNLRIQAAPEYQQSTQDITRLMLTSPTGRMATVGELAEVRRSNGLFSVNRYERRRAVMVRCQVRDDLGVVPDHIFNELRKSILPEFGFLPVTGDNMTFLGQPGTEAEGVRASFTGENEERDKNMKYLSQSMIVGVVLIGGILVLQFNSFRQTVIVLFTVPLSFVGVVFGMWLCNFDFSLASFIGLVSLTGIVVNDAIVLVDFTNQARSRGANVKDALLEACVNRLRPVCLTTATTIGGLMPMFLNISGGTEFWQPLTGAIIFGLLFATVLTLIVIPVAYSLVYSWSDRRTGDAS